MIRAAKIDEIYRDSGEWVFVDVGFAQASTKSCGIAIADEEPRNVCYAELLDELRGIVNSGTAPLNLLLEAPLSVAFDKQGNPRGRAIEKRDAATRYWYVGLGCSVLLAATYILRSIHAVGLIREVRLVEGFASFKDKGATSSHKDDVRRLREVAWSSATEVGKIIAPEFLVCRSDDQLCSAFAVSGMDFGIPPVVMLGA